MSSRRSPKRHTRTRTSASSRSKSPRRSPNKAKSHDSARVYIVGAVFGVLALLLMVSLVRLQVVNSDRYVDIGERQRTNTRDLIAFRGSVVDRDGFVLAASTPSTRVTADPTMIEDPAATAQLLAPTLGGDAGLLAQMLTADSDSDRYAELARNLDLAAADTIRAFRVSDPDLLAGIFLEAEEKRVYPGGDLARPIVGRVDPDEVGVYGVEYLYDEVMTGTAGRQTNEKGAGRYGTISVGEFTVDPAREGYDLVLTIDYRLQYVAEQALIEHCEETGGNWATAVGSDPRTGEILFMGTAHKNEDGSCSVPGYNAALVKTFEPGSVIKAVTVAAVVENLGVDRNTTYEVPRELVIGDRTFVQGRNFPPAPYSVENILANSMNIGTMLMASDLGPDALYENMVSFGLGQPTGIGFKGEATGRVRDPSEWFSSNMGSIPIGQGMTTNAVQLLSAYNTIANDGVFVDPRLVRALVSPEGEEILTDPQNASRAVSASTANEVTAMLESVVDYGSGVEAQIPGYSVAGKTGTAWKVFEQPDGENGYGGQGNRRYIVTFAGFVPAENPELSMVVVVDEPQSSQSAGTIAAPLFRDIGQYALRILGVPPTDIDAIDTGDGPVRAAPTPLPVVPAPEAETPEELALVSDESSG